MQTMDAMAETTSRGKSLVQLGYKDNGLDDNWQACGAGVNGSFHDEGGRPIVNTALFPDMSAMTAHAAALGIDAGWYGNNCICRELGLNASFDPLVYRGDVASHIELGFRSTKLDGCGQFLDLELYYELFESTGIPFLIENCHWGSKLVPQAVPTADWCPWSYFRTSGDISANWGSMFANLQTVVPFLSGDVPLARPGCWAYPDMLEVGRLASFEEDRAHFSAWAVTSSPLILGHNLLDKDVADAVWPVISNEEVIAVNQQWAGHPGKLVRSEPSYSGVEDAVFPWGMLCNQVEVGPDFPNFLAGFPTFLDGEWSFDAAAGELAFATAGGDTRRRCLDYSDPSGELFLAPCGGGTGGSAQRFAYDAVARNFVATEASSPPPSSSASSSSMCLTLFNFAGPAWDEPRSLRLVGCGATAGPDDPDEDASKQQLFDLPNGDGALVANGDGRPKCIAARAGASPSFSTVGLQLWTKAQPGGAVAALVLNNNNTVAGGATMTLDFAELLFDGGEGGVEGGAARGGVAVRDLHSRAELGEFMGSFTTAAIPQHDGAFLLLTPVVAAAAV